MFEPAIKSCFASAFDPLHTVITAYAFKLSRNRAFTLHT